MMLQEEWGRLDRRSAYWGTKGEGRIAMEGCDVMSEQRKSTLLDRLCVDREVSVFAVEACDFILSVLARSVTCMLISHGGGVLV
jgi:hypothetical protein